jgi:hypothetical protein
MLVVGFSVSSADRFALSRSASLLAPHRKAVNHGSRVQGVPIGHLCAVNLNSFALCRFVTQMNRLSKVRKLGRIFCTASTSGLPHQYL